MSVRLKELVDQARGQGHDIALVAGAGGLDHAVRWVHMVENEEIAGFLEGQEIAFTTGIGLESQEDLVGLTHSAYDSGASGIVVNVGPFIHQISPEAVRFCNERDFPMFRVPWSEHMAQIMHLFSLSITMSEKHNMELAAALENAIFMPTREDLYLETMERSGFGKDWNYCVAVFEVCAEDGEPVPDARMDSCAARIETLLTSRQWHAVQLTIGHRIALVFTRYDIGAVSDMTQAATATCAEFLGEGTRVFVGVGKVTRSARCIGKSYRQALALERLQWLHGTDGEPFLYDDAGSDKLLLSVNDPEILADYYDTTIGPLAKHDQLNGGDLVETLRNYLAFSGSIKETSERMFVHRNTVSYKLGKIQDLLGVNLSDFRTREEMSIGFRVKELLDCVPAEGMDGASRGTAG
ncbi:PucR family transcriptional regulator [Bifidobacterium eulemuris]|uniref:PucR family transcriptional regulator n=1 Tax=Bifidobacterium eulemuris TaxID=1765219 RepID=A0A261GE34_9BIFI|nr:PucR family transcriptional regulator [Bifidobacterium eulemuris]OZG69664.1 PucR family transcriptional regulator [Bifidobacterium eulemuris]QOL32227.1 PucR family transcriptional regulator ligand-binding domain-containing protein [Bifidobacterium eulemuris]